MTDFNPTGKTIQELIKEQESKGVQVIIVDAGEYVEMETIRTLKRTKDDFKGVLIINDIDFAQSISIEEDTFPPNKGTIMELLKEEAFKISARVDDLSDVFIYDNPKSWQEHRPMKVKLKGYMRGNNGNKKR